MSDRERLSEATQIINDVLAQPVPPEDKVRADDEGELYTVMSVRDGLLYLDFGHPVKWIALTKADAEALIAVMQKRLAEL